MICVQGRQYIWRYVYGAACQNNPFKSGLPYSYQEMVVPPDVTVVLSITSVDVIHSWWVPSLGGKVDAVPGYTTYTWFKAARPRAVPRPVRAAVRPPARVHDRAGAGGAAQPVPGLAQRQLEADIQKANSQVTLLRAYLTKNGNL